MTIHIEGMGFLGSLLACRLDSVGVPFTWHDIDAEFTAWKASSGMVYPAGDELSQRCLKTWFEWVDAGWLPTGIAEPVRFTYTHKSPPHGATNGQIDLGDMRVGQADCLTVNPATLVEATRERFADRRLHLPLVNVLCDKVVRAHGFTERMTKANWGWSARVMLDLPNDLLVACGGLRPSFYSRRQRWQVVYAYPEPGANCYRAGSSEVTQTTLKHLDPAKHYQRWFEGWQQLWPRVKVTDRGYPVEGWRPRNGDLPHEWSMMKFDKVGVKSVPRLTFPSMWHSGVRWAPEVIEQAMAWIGQP